MNMANLLSSNKQTQSSLGLIITKDVLITGVVAFALSFLLVGFQLQTLQGQPLSYELRLTDVVWAVALVMGGRLLLVLDSHGYSKIVVAPAAFAALYLILLGVLGVQENPIYNDLPLPFTSPTVNAIFGVGALILSLKAINNHYGRRAQGMSAEIREKREIQRNLFNKRFSLILGPVLILLAVILPMTPWGDKGRVDTLVVILTYVMLGWGLNIVVGLAGLLDLGYVAFFAVGSYSYAKLSLIFGLNFWETLPLAGIFAAMFGVALGFPVLRLRGDYLAIVTLGFGEMIRIILLNWSGFTGGAQGITGVPYMDFFGIPFTRNPAEGTESFHTLFGLDFSTSHRVYFTYYVVLVLALMTNFVTLRLRKLPIGRAWEALREDEIACRALGINPRNTKLTAFGIGAMFAGFAGSFFATRLGFVAPFSFTFDVSAGILAFVVLGGMGSQVGVAIAAIILVGLPQVTKDLQLYRALIYGCAMVLIMLWRPRGLLSHRDPTILAVSTAKGIFGMFKRG